VSGGRLPYEISWHPIVSNKVAKVSLATLGGLGRRQVTNLEG
jgi:hypothetical protein